MTRLRGSRSTPTFGGSPKRFAGWKRLVNRDPIVLALDLGVILAFLAIALAII